MRGLVSAVTNLPEGQFTIDVSPNPVSDYLTIELISPISGEVQLQLVGLNGNAIQNYVQIVEKGIPASIQIDVSGLSAGIYIAQPIINNRLLAIQKILKL